MPHTGHASCEVCGAVIKSWSESTHVAIFELVKSCGRKAGAYSRDGTCTTINPRRICLIAGLRQGFDAPGSPNRTQRPTDPTRVHSGIVGRTSTNERWQAEGCGRRMTDKHPKRRLGTQPAGGWGCHTQTPKLGRCAWNFFRARLVFTRTGFQCLGRPRWATPLSPSGV